MKKRISSAFEGSIAILLILFISIPFQSTNASQRSVPTFVKLAGGDSYFLGGMNGELYYEYRSQLWKTNGTAAGSVLLTNAIPLGPHIHRSNIIYFPFYPKHYPKGVVSNSIFFFSADDRVHGQELWRSDGTPAGTFMLKDIFASGSSNPENFIDVNGTVFFKTSDVCYPECALWRTDGTSDGTFFVKAISLVDSDNTELSAASINGILLFQSADELWRSDGTIAGTTLIKSGINILAEAGQKVYLSATSDDSLWAADGTSTLQLTNFPVVFYACASSSCYFSEQTSSGPEGIWRTDGTPGGTFKLANTLINYPRIQLCDANGMVYIAIVNGSYELWKTDGTPGGTALVKDNLAGVSDLTFVNGQLYFIANDESGFSQLWKSNGTSLGTSVVVNFGNNQNVLDIEVLNRIMFLKVGEPLVLPPGEYITYQTWHLHQSDGTQVGTAKVPNGDFAHKMIVCPSPLCWSSILDQEQSMQVGGKWYFVDSDPVAHNPALWMVDDIYFRDVLPDHWAFTWVERLTDAGITAGCGIDIYCPETPITRAQIAVFLERGRQGSSYTPPPATGTVFTDVPSSYWAASWIEQLAADGITGGCETGHYCPDSAVSRAQMAVFLLKSKYGPSYIPPEVDAGTGFSDVPTNYWSAAWIKQLAAEGITGGCGTNLYCPESPVTRAQMAVFLVRTFSLP